LTRHFDQTLTTKPRLFVTASWRLDSCENRSRTQTISETKTHWTRD